MWSWKLFWCACSLPLGHIVCWWKVKVQLLCVNIALLLIHDVHGIALWERTPVFISSSSCFDFGSLLCIYIRESAMRALSTLWGSAFWMCGSGFWCAKWYSFAKILRKSFFIWFLGNNRTCKVLFRTVISMPKPPGLGEVESRTWDLETRDIKDPQFPKEFSEDWNVVSLRRSSCCLSL